MNFLQHILHCELARLSLALDTHVQRGLQYLVCVSVSVSVCLIYDYSRTTGTACLSDIVLPTHGAEGLHFGAFHFNRFSSES